MSYKPGAVWVGPVDRADQRFAHWPKEWDLAWWFIPSGERGDTPPQIVGDAEIRSFDAVAQGHIAQLASLPGIPVRQADGAVKEVPYRALDEEADYLVRRGMQPSPDRSPITVRFTDGTTMKNTPRDWWEQLVAMHIDARARRPAVQLNFGARAITVPFLWFDALCKDYVQRRGDMLAVGAWPELLIRERIADPSNPGPLPVDGRPNALGMGVRVTTPEELQRASPAHGGGAHPLENEGVV